MSNAVSYRPAQAGPRTLAIFYNLKIGAKIAAAVLILTGVLAALNYSGFARVTDEFRTFRQRVDVVVFRRANLTP